ncbi:type II toxin-antitoxin system RatA family toxin [Planosporangium sp. 12N6]|uniref:type II toxin-antitoxin system RatA family toxin n=1 Tax=Planosporangium spinosum TaxID=3402278 RepID=UPI003CEFE49F
MPDVAIDLDIRAPAARVWQVVTDIERYPDSMDSVRWVKILDDTDPLARRSGWSVLLKGSILEWEEVERLDPERLVMAFHQVTGDMETFDGQWRVTPLDDGRTNVTLRISFEIGIPLLAEMLNPVAERSLRANCREMLLGIERDAVRPG